MSRLRNVNTGVVVSVADEKVERFGSDWVPADDAPSDAVVTRAAPTKKPTAKK